MFEPLNVPMELRCGACGRVESYLVGRLAANPAVIVKGDPEIIDEAVCFTRYFHCKHCGAGGPWELTRASRTLVATLLAESLRNPENARIHLMEMALFDGTPLRWPTQGEAHLKQLIEKDPSNAFLWNRLGNLYKVGEVFEQALAAYREALARNEHDLESMHSMAQLLLERGEDEEAARLFHQFLRHARQAPGDMPLPLLRGQVRYALEALAALHRTSGEKIPFLPTEPLPEPKPGQEAEPVVVQLSSYDLSKEEDWERMVDSWLPPGRARERPGTVPRRGHPPRLHREHPPTPRPRLTPGGEGRVGRNDPCPCGSGKKYKNCCMRR
jgi:hypothetical protein